MVLLDVYGADGSLFVNGQPLSIKGVNWFGSESYGGPPGGLTVHTIDFYLDFLQGRRDGERMASCATPAVAATICARSASWVSRLAASGRASSASWACRSAQGPKEATSNAKPAKEEKEEVELD